MTGQTIESLHPDLGTFVDWVWALKQERDELRARLKKPVADFNPEHTLFNEIRTSTPVNDECGALQYLVNEQQLQRIRELEVPDAQHGRDSAELRKLCQSRDDARRERDLLKAELDARVRQVERLLGEYQEALSDIRALRKELDFLKPVPVRTDQTTIGYTGCLICGQYTGHGGLQCPNLAARSLQMEHQRVVPVEPIRVPHPLDVALTRKGES